MSTPLPNQVPGEARATWIRILTKLQEDLNRITKVPETISTEAEFRDKFFSTCEDFGIGDAERQFGFFSRHHEQIVFFVKVLDEALFLDQPKTLSSVFWHHAFAAISIALEQEFVFSEFRDLYPDINEKLPVLSSDLSQFPKSQKVQEPLQLIFEAYLACYIELIKGLRTEDDNIDRKPIHARIAIAAKIYESQEAQYRQRILDVQEEIRTIAPNFLGAGGDNEDDRFQHVRQLGRGSYGMVDEVKELTTGSVYARKSIPRKIPGQDENMIAQRVKNEVDIMGKLQHNHIARLNMWFKGKTYWSMIMLPVADCDLKVFLDERCTAAGYPKDAMKMLDPWFGCLISAMTYAHDERVKHEDIKPSNILIKGKKIYLTDFGTAKDFSEYEQSTVSDYFESGTPVYWAPEPRNWGRPADIFALGCVFSEMLTVRQHKSLQDFRKFRINTSQEMRYAFKSNLRAVKRWLKQLDGINDRDPAAQLLLEQTLNMLVEDSEQRLSAKRLRRNLRAEEDLFCSTCF